MGQNKCTYIRRRPSIQNEGIESRTGFSKDFWPLIYLEAPIAVGRYGVSYFQSLVDKIHQRIGGWGSCFLNAW